MNMIDWLNSEEGKLAIKKVMEQSAEEVKKFKEAEKVDPEILYTPFTI